MGTILVDTHLTTSFCVGPRRASPDELPLSQEIERSVSNERKG